MSSRNRRHQANVRERYAEEVAELRNAMCAMLTNSQTNRLGRNLSTYVATYRRKHGRGPSRCEATSTTGLNDLVPAMPDYMPHRFEQAWRNAALDIIMAAIRRRGWVTWTHETRSLNIGNRYRATCSSKTTSTASPARIAS